MTRKPPGRRGSAAPEDPAVTRTRGDSERARLVYIMGRGHSGSTVLDGLLGSAGGIEGLGELVAGLGREEGRCGCGASIRRCGFWAEVRERYEGETDTGDWGDAVTATRSQAHVSRFLRTLLADENDPELVALARKTQTLVSSAASAAGADLVVDSSKEISRGLFLSRFVPRTRLVHLVRDPTRVAASTLERVRGQSGFVFLRRRYRNRRAEPIFMALSAVGWLVGNLMAEIVRLRGDGEVLRVRFEDLCEDPSRELRRIGDFIGTDLTGLAERVAAGESLRTGHVIAGNRMRHRETFVFEPERAAGRHLPWYHAALVWLITWPLVLVYRFVD